MDTETPQECPSKSGVGGVVADSCDEPADDAGDIGVGRGVDLAGDVDETGGTIVSTATLAFGS